MPYYYSSTNTPVTSGRQISLSLKDLDASVGSIRIDENYPANMTPEQHQQPQQHNEYSDNTLHSSYQEVDQHEQQYQQNVNSLLNKSSGSQYEEMIKKFLSGGASRGNIGSGDGDDNSREMNDTTPRTPASAAKTRADISLAESSTKLAERAAARQSRSAILRRSQQQAEAVMQQEVITEVLAAPLERNKYIPPDRSGVPTNQYGRQRAAPRTTHPPQSPINSPNKFKKSHQTQGNNLSLHAKVAADTTGASRSVSVSIEDFNDWIAKNQSWREKIAEKKQQHQIQKQQRDSLCIRTPNLASSVQLHAERSYIRKHTRGRSPGSRGGGGGGGGGRGGGGEHSHSRVCSTRSHSPQPGTRRGGHYSTASVSASEGQRGMGMQLGELDDSTSISQSLVLTDVEGEVEGEGEERSQSNAEHHPLVRNEYEKDVFQRLYEEGRQFNDFNESMDEHRSRGRFRSNEMSFSPRINQKSTSLMKKRSTNISSLFRSCSPSSYRLSDISYEERQQHAEQAHRHRVRSVSPAMQRRQARESVTLRGSSISKSYLSSKGGKMYPETVVASILSEGKVSDVLCSSRIKSIKNAAAINQERKLVSSDYDTTLSDGGKMFTPRMVSKESKRINSRDDTTFEDRMLKSIDEYRIKVKVNREAAAITPGPGQYSNTEECNRCCPLPKERTRSRGRSSTPSTPGDPASSAMRSKSPGAAAYSFSRARRTLL